MNCSNCGSEKLVKTTTGYLCTVCLRKYTEIENVENSRGNSNGKDFTKEAFDKLDRATAVITSIVFKRDEDGAYGEVEGSGTAWFVDYNGYGKYLVTNCHVVIDGDMLLAQFSKTIDPRQEKYPVTIIYKDIANDLALLQLDADIAELNILKGRVSLPIADIDDVQEGDEVYTLGNPIGRRFVLAKGFVSGTRYGDYGFDEQKGYNRILVDITATNGNSGGAVINNKGEVIGVVTQASPKQMPHNIAFETNNMFAKRKL